MNSMPTNADDILYFDGACPLCSKEMAHLARLKDARLTLVDVHSLPDSQAEPSKAAMLEVLHLKRGDTWITGVDANVAAWRHTQIGLLWQALRWPILGAVVDWVYKHWARRRFEKLYGNGIPCTDTQCSSPSDPT